MATIANECPQGRSGRIFRVIAEGRKVTDPDLRKRIQERSERHSRVLR